MCKFSSYLEKIRDPGLPDPPHELLLPVSDHDLAASDAANLPGQADRLQAEQSFRYVLRRGRHAQSARGTTPLQLRVRVGVRGCVRRRGRPAHAQVLRVLAVLVALLHGHHGGDLSGGLRGQWNGGQAQGQGQPRQGVDQQGLVAVVGQGEAGRGGWRVGVLERAERGGDRGQRGVVARGGRGVGREAGGQRVGALVGRAAAPRPVLPDGCGMERVKDLGTCSLSSFNCVYLRASCRS